MPEKRISFHCIRWIALQESSSRGHDKCSLIPIIRVYLETREHVEIILAQVQKVHNPWNSNSAHPLGSDIKTHFWCKAATPDKLAGLVWVCVGVRQGCFHTPLRLVSHQLGTHVVLKQAWNINKMQRNDNVTQHANLVQCAMYMSM